MALIIHKPFFTNEELSVLQRAFDLACADLKLSPAAHSSRTRLGALIFDLATHGEADCAELRRQSTERLKASGMAQSAKVYPIGLVSLSSKLRRDKSRQGSGHH